MSNYNVNWGVRSQQQIAFVAGLLGAVVGGIGTHQSDGNPLIGALIVGAICFVLGLSRRMGIMISVLSGLIIYAQMSGS